MPRKNDHTLTFTLRQHTPLIHFQANQPGATLRATELKPKLDRFLIRHAFDDEIERYKTFLIGYNKEKEEKEKKRDYLNSLKRALDYRIHIVADTVQTKEIHHKAYFANMGKEPHEKRKATLAKEIKITIASLHADLLNNIKEYINFFFLTHNFGTRQTKGFGSFYLDENDPLYENPLEAAKKYLNFFLYAHYTGKKSPEVFKHVEVIYPLMKSGINFPDYPKKTILKNGKEKQVPDPSQGRGPKASYYKSFLFQYMLENNIGNEKRFIKEKFFKKEVRLPDDGMLKRYVRAMLGAASFIEFRDHKRRGKIIYKHDTIKRFRSPVIFKVIDNLLLLFPETIHPKMFGTQYTFGMDTGKTDKNGNPVTRDDETINTPSQFDLTDFLKQFAAHFNTLEIGKDQEFFNMFDTAIENARETEMNVFEKKAAS